MKLVSLYSTIKMMHGPINIRVPRRYLLFIVTMYELCQELIKINPFFYHVLFKWRLNLKHKVTILSQ